MSKNNDIYAIVGRIKNLIAKDDLALTESGKILVNTYALVLKELHDFSEKLPGAFYKELSELLIKKESLPHYVLSLSTPKEDLEEEEAGSDWSSPRFASNEEAYKHYTTEYEALGAKYGMTGDDFWCEAENESHLTEDHIQIMSLSRGIAMLKHLMGKNNAKL